VADEDSQPKGLESLLQTLDPERREILLFILEQDHLARLGAELVGPRAFSPKSTGPGRLGWTTRNWGDITFSKEPSEKKRVFARQKKQEILKQASESSRWGSERSGHALYSPLEKKENRTAAEKLLYKDGILQPFVFFDRQTPSANNPESKKPLVDEMIVLSHELAHVADVWQTEHRADMDAEFGGPATPEVDDYLKYDHPMLLTKKEKYKSDPGGRFRQWYRWDNQRVYDEPYSRLMDRYNRERLSLTNRAGPPLNRYTAKRENLGYIPDRYQRSQQPRSGWTHDPFATGYSTWSFPPEVESREAAAHPAQGGALMELNRLKGRDPLEGMDAWLQRHKR